MFSNHRVERQLRGAMVRHRRSCGESRCASPSRSARRAAWPARRAAACCFLCRSAVSPTSGLGLTVARVVEDALSVTAAATCDLRSALPVRSRVHGTTPSFFFSPARATTGGCERRAAERVKLCRAAAHLSFEPPTSRSRSRLDLGVLPQCEAARCRKRKRGSAP